MKMEYNKKYLFLGLALAAVIIIFVWLASSYSWWYENRLIEKYLNDPERKQFAEMLRKDQNDLADNPERFRKIGITMDIGLQWFNLMQYDLAIKWWKKGLKIEPNNDIGWYNLGNAYRELRLYGKAEDAFEKGMYISAVGEIDSCLALGEMYRYQYKKKRNKENNVYLECLKKHKDNRDLIARLALYYRDTGNKEKAIKYFDKLFSIDPGSSVEIGEEINKLQEELRQESIDEIKD